MSWGVRQGGILSPILFSIYINDVIMKLEKSNKRCHINNTFLGCILYADDILLISPSITGMQDMLDICQTEMKWLNMKINAAKSATIRFGSRCETECSSLCIDGIDIQLPMQSNILKFLYCRTKHLLMTLILENKKFSGL